MSVVERTLRDAPPARAPLVNRIAVGVLERELAHLRGGALEVTLPDGSRRRFGSADPVPVRVQIHDRAVFRRFATRGKVGFGESYTAGDWDCDDLVSLFELLVRNADATAARLPALRRVLAARPRPNRRNNLRRARRNIAYHYDLGNDFFALMLDDTMTYSCAVFDSPDLSLSDRVTVVEQDFREHDGRYTKVASIEMLEAIGERQVGPYFATIDRVLDPGGIACVQTILIPDDRWDRYRTSPDWIEQYIFPGCLIPSLTAVTSAATRSSRLMVHEVEEIGPHYAETLRRWRRRFHAQIDDVRALGYDQRFERTWDFYLAFCEAGFRTRALRDVQLTLTRPLNESLPA